MTNKKPSLLRIKRPNDIYECIKNYANKRQENFLVITLNGFHELIKVHRVTVGIANKTIIHPRECFYHCIKDNAVAVAFAHNHPSCQVTPSQEDIDISRRLEMACKILGFNMIDNVIIAKYGLYYSFAEQGHLGRIYSDTECREYSDMIAAENNGG